MAKVLPGLVKWVQDKAVKFEPDRNSVTTLKGDTIEYEYLLVAVGLQTNYNLVLLTFVRHWDRFN